jgi:hypothetical protein
MPCEKGLEERDDIKEEMGCFENMNFLSLQRLPCYPTAASPNRMVWKREVLENQDAIASTKTELNGTFQENVRFLSKLAMFSLSKPQLGEDLELLNEFLQE